MMVPETGEYTSAAALVDLVPLLLLLFLNGHLIWGVQHIRYRPALFGHDH